MIAQLAAAIIIAVSATASDAASPAPSPGASSQSSPAVAASSQAEIVNSGSTNTSGYVVRVSRSGSAAVQLQGQSGERDATVPAELAARFFAAIDAAEPLSAMPVARCMKSASFGYVLRVRYKGATTPDLTCPANDAVRELATLSAQIAHAAGVPSIVFRRSIQVPQVPSPTAT
jgi:hypothetical protein